MKDWTKILAARARAHRPPRYVPPFHPVPLRARKDGWTPARQARFIGLLAETGSVARAAIGVGMARESAYRLRRRAGAAGFAAAWDAALGKPMRQADGRVTDPAPKVTQPSLQQRAAGGLIATRMYRGRHIASHYYDDVNALVALMRPVVRQARAAAVRAAKSHSGAGGAAVTRPAPPANPERSLTPP